MRCVTIAILVLALKDVSSSVAQELTPPIPAASATVRVYMPGGSAPGRRLPFELISGSTKISFGDTDSKGEIVLSVLPGSTYTIVFETDNQSFSTTTVQFRCEGVALQVPVFLNPIQRQRRMPPGSPGVAVTELQKPPKEARSLREQGLRAFAAGNQNGAIALFEGAVSLCPSYVDALNDLGVALLRMGNLARAEEVLTRAVKFGPSSETARLNLGIVWTREHRYVEAIETLQRLRRENPGDARVPVALADALVGQNRLDEAATALGDALRIGGMSGSSKGEIHYKYGLILIGKQLYPEAAKEFAKAVRLMPRNPFAHLELGIASLRSGQLKTAERELKTAYQMGGGDLAAVQSLLDQIHHSRE